MGGYIIIDDSCRVTQSVLLDVRFTVRIKLLTVCGGRWDAKHATAATLMAQLTLWSGSPRSADVLMRRRKITVICPFYSNRS